MPNYRRANIKGGTFFFTVVLADRSSRLLIEEIDRLRRAYRIVQQRRPFETIAICILPDHIHAIWSLPEHDSDFATRWSLIKGGFSRGIDAPSGSQSQASKRENGIWQRRYWEHTIRDDADFERHVDYVHFNPVKHGTSRASRIGPTALFTASSNTGYLHPIGVEILRLSRDRSASKTAGTLRFAHPTAGELMRSEECKVGKANGSARCAVR